MRRLALTLLVPLLLTSCSGDDKETGPTPDTSGCDFNATFIPASCVEGGPSETPASFPDDASKIPSVALPSVKGKLGGAGNTADPSLRTATFTVTVPQGSRIGSVVMCLGNGKLTLDTVPTSKAFVTISCDADPVVPSELIAEDPAVLAKTTTYTVTVKADGPIRWEAAVFGTTAPPGQSQD